MSIYSVSGSFGKVKSFNTAINSQLFESIDHISTAGWHSVNDLYRIDRPEGASRNIILFTLSGKGILEINGAKHILTKGTAAIIPKQYANAYRADKDYLWEFYWIGYYGTHSQNLTEDIIKSGDYTYSIGVNEIELLLKPIKNAEPKGVERELMESEILSRILIALLKKSVTSDYDSNQKTAINRMIAFLENSRDFDFCLDKLSKEYHYSKEHIIRLFKKATGMTPYRYWQTLRFKQCCIALENRSQPISEIAEEFGYKNISSFSKQFKEFEGISPKEYRKLYGIIKN